MLGPGTGLGVSGLVPQGTGLIALDGEGGHATLPVSTEREAAAIARLRGKHGHVSAERVLSGPGLAGLYQALAALEAETVPELEPAEVAHIALIDPASIARRATDMFCEMLGTVAADVALTLGATGGVYLAGGVVPALGDLFLRSGFRARFEAKGRFSSYLARILVYIC